MSELSESPWKNVAVDFIGLFPSGDYVAVVIDEYSRFPKAEIVTSTSAVSHPKGRCNFRTARNSRCCQEWQRSIVQARNSKSSPLTVPWFPSLPYKPLLVQNQWRSWTFYANLGQVHPSSAFGVPTLETRVTKFPSTVTGNTTFHNKHVSLRSFKWP